MPLAQQEFGFHNYLHTGKEKQLSSASTQGLCSQQNSVNKYLTLAGHERSGSQETRVKEADQQDKQKS